MLGIVASTMDDKCLSDLRSRSYASLVEARVTRLGDPQTKAFRARPRLPSWGYSWPGMPVYDAKRSFPPTQGTFSIKQSSDKLPQSSWIKPGAKPIKPSLEMRIELSRTLGEKNVRVLKNWRSGERVCWKTNVLWAGQRLINELIH